MTKGALFTSQKTILAEDMFYLVFAQFTVCNGFWFVDDD